MRCGSIILFGLGLLSFGLIITCVAGDVWAKASYNSLTTVRQGLWRRCINDDCLELGDAVESWYQVVRALAVLTCLFSFIGTVLSLLLVCAKHFPSSYISWFFLCAVCSMVASLIVFITKIPSTPGGSLGWCYIVGWVGVIFNLSTFLFGFCSEKF